MGDTPMSGADLGSPAVPVVWSATFVTDCANGLLTV